MSTFTHVPIMLDEVLELVDPRPGQVVIDATVGGGGHASAIAQRIAPGGHLIGFDQDDAALAAAEERLNATQARISLVHANFRELRARLDELDCRPVDGVLFDLGVSSPQLDQDERGFSYWGDADLDMRMDRRRSQSAADLLAVAEEAELVTILQEYGEERWAKRIAHFVVERREREPIRRADQLVAIIKSAIPAAARRRGPHPARRTFQALRIAVNDEFGALREGLAAAIGALRPGGRLAVITFHSLEDRIVKSVLREAASGCTCPPDLPVCACGKQPTIELLTRKPVVPTADEVDTNPRSRSAKLRAAIKS